MKNHFIGKTAIGGLVLAMAGSLAGCASGEKKVPAGPVIQKVGTGARVVAAVTDVAPLGPVGALVDIAGGFISMKEDAEQIVANRPAKRNKLYVGEFGERMPWEDRFEGDPANDGHRGFMPKYYLDKNTNISFVVNTSFLEGEVLEFEMFKIQSQEEQAALGSKRKYILERKHSHRVGKENCYSWDPFEDEQVVGEYDIYFR